MTVENNTTPAADTTTSSDAAGAVAEEKDVTAADAATDAADDLLGDTTENEGVAAEGSEEQGEAGDEQNPDDGDDLLEGKVAEDEKKEGEEGDDADYTLTAPEGYELDSQLADSFTPVAKELGLSKDQAQGLVEKFGPTMLTHVGEKYAQQWREVQKGWATEAKADPDIFDAKTKSVRPEVAVGRDYLGKEFTAVIKQLGGNNNPAVLKALAKVGKALGEDAPGFGKPAAPSEPVEHRLYPNDKPKPRT